MNDTNESIKKEFEDTIELFKINNNKVKKFKIRMLYVLSIFLFLSVLTGTIISYKNYLKAKDRQTQKDNVVELSLTRK